jgi:hypothetical protein
MQGSHDINIANKSFENLAKFRYLGLAITDQNYVHEEVECRLNLGNPCSH